MGDCSHNYASGTPDTPAVGGQKQMVRVFVATWGYSRRQFAAAYEEESLP